MTGRRPSVHIRALPSFNATRRAIEVAYCDEGINRRSLRYAYGVLAVVVTMADWGRIPANWATGGGTFAKGYALYNAGTALERLRSRLEPLDFDVDFEGLQGWRTTPPA